MSLEIFNRTPEQNRIMLSMTNNILSAKTQENKEMHREIRKKYETQLQNAYEDKCMEQFIKDINGYDPFA